MPGCLNTLFASNSSTGCSLNTDFKGSINGAERVVSFGGGNQLVLRYKTPATITNNKVVKVTDWNGSNVSVNMRVWLSKSATDTYANVPAECKQTSSGVPSIFTGSVTNGFITTSGWGGTTSTPVTYCKLDPNTVYYFGIEYDETNVVTPRFQVQEMQADFL